jgi:hypothetical protein
LHSSLPDVVLCCSALLFLAVLFCVVSYFHVLCCVADIEVSDVQICCSLARGVIHGSLDCVNPCGLPPEDRLLLSMSPHVLVPGAWEQDERSAAHKKQQQQLQQQQSQQEGQLEAQLAAEFGDKLALQDSPQLQQHLQADPRAAVAGLTEQQHIPAGEAAPDPLTSSSAAVPGSSAALLDDPLGCGGSACFGSHARHASDAADNAGCASSQAHGEPEFTDPLRRRTLQGDEGLLGDELGLSEQEMGQQEVQSAAAMAALAGLPRATQGLQLYDRYGGPEGSHGRHLYAHLRRKLKSAAVGGFSCAYAPCITSSVAVRLACSFLQRPACV